MMVDTRKPGAVPTALLQHLADGKCMSIDEIAAALEVSTRQASDGARKLFGRGYLLKSASGGFQLSDDGLVAAGSGAVITSGPKGATGKVRVQRDTFRERAWAAMRVERSFTIGAIVCAAERKGEANGRENARKYIAQLCWAGFVKEDRRRVPGTAVTSNGFKRFTLVKNTGSRAPVYRAENNVMHDFNTGEDVPCRPR